MKNKNKIKISTISRHRLYHIVTYAPRGTLGGKKKKKKRAFKMLQNTNKKSLAEGVTKSQKRKDSEAKEALQSGKGYRITKKKKLDR